MRSDTLTPEDLAESFDRAREADRFCTYSKSPESVAYLESAVAAAPYLEAASERFRALDALEANVRAVLDSFRIKQEPIVIDTSLLSREDNIELRYRFQMLQTQVPSRTVFIVNLVNEVVPEPSCECGAHKVGYARGPGHSSWCPWSKS